MFWSVSLLFVGLVSQAEKATSVAELTLRNGDRIVFVGDGLIERMQKDNRLEAALLSLYPSFELKFRNLGWNGDTVRGVSRCYFDPPEEGFKRLVEQVRAEKPSVLFVGYGSSDSFAGAAGLPEFRREYGKLLDDIALGVDRVVLIGPASLPKLPSPFPDAASTGRNMSLYNDVVREIAKKRGYRFVDVFGPMAEIKTMPNLPSDSTPPLFQPEPIATRNNMVQQTLANAILHQLFAEKTLSHSGDLKQAVPMTSPELEELVARKNSFFFQRYRPQNITYLLGFRRYEQGQNARELEQLDRLVAETERKIDSLRRKSQ